MSTPLATLTRAREIARTSGLRYVYTGNVRDSEAARIAPGAGGGRRLPLFVGG